MHSWVQAATSVHSRLQPLLHPWLHDAEPLQRTSQPPMPQFVLQLAAAPHSTSTDPGPPFTEQSEPSLQTTLHPPASQFASQDASGPQSRSTLPELPLTEQVDPLSHTMWHVEPRLQEKSQSSPDAQVQVSPGPHSSAEHPAVEKRHTAAQSAASEVTSRTV